MFSSKELLRYWWLVKFFMALTNNNFTLWSGLGRKKSWLFVMEVLTVTVFVGEFNQDRP